MLPVGGRLLEPLGAGRRWWNRARARFQFSGAGEVPDGLLLHDLARDVLDADWRWRDPEGYKDLFRRLRGHVHAALKSSRGREQQRSIFDLKLVFRNLPGVLSPVDWDVWGSTIPNRPAPRTARAFSSW